MHLFTFARRPFQYKKALVVMAHAAEHHLTSAEPAGCWAQSIASRKARAACTLGFATFHSVTEPRWQRRIGRNPGLPPRPPPAPDIPFIPARRSQPQQPAQLRHAQPGALGQHAAQQLAQQQVHHAVARAVLRPAGHTHTQHTTSHASASRSASRRHCPARRRSAPRPRGPARSAEQAYSPHAA